MEKAKYLIFSVPRMATRFPTKANRGHSFLKLCRHLTGTPFRIVNEMEYLFEEKHFWKTSKNSKPTKNCSVFQGNCWVFLFLTKCTDIPLSDHKPPEIRLHLSPTITYWKLNQQSNYYHLPDRAHLGQNWQNTANTWYEQGHI